MSILKKLFASEPVRVLLYSLLTALVATLVTKGIVSSDMSQYLLVAVALVLGVPAVEVARAKVTPIAPPPEAGK